MVGLNAVEPATPAAASPIVAPSGARKVTSRNPRLAPTRALPHRPGGVSFLLQRWPACQASKSGHQFEGRMPESPVEQRQAVQLRLALTARLGVPQMDTTFEFASLHQIYELLRPALPAG
jgi:hypothetical protein